MFPLPQAPRLIGRGSISADCKLDSSSQDPQIGNKWKELRTPTRGEIDNIFCRHANCGCNPDEGYGLFGMVEQQHSDILSALARGSQEDSRGEEIEYEVFFSHQKSYHYFVVPCFLILPHSVPDISLMFSYGYTSWSYVPKRVLFPDKSLQNARPAELRCAQRMCRLAFGAWPTGYWHASYFDVSLKVGECSNTFHWAKMIPNLWSPVRKFWRHSYASRDNWWWLGLTRRNQ